MNYFKYYLAILVFAMALAVSCTKDLDPEITSLDLSRLLSPTALDATIADRTSVRLTWAKVPKAETYVAELYANGNLDFSGTPAKQIKDITFDQIPYTITKLEGDFNYSIRVKAIGKDIPESKWIATTFKTDPEQLFKPLDSSKLMATQVTLQWTSGETVTNIVLNPGNVNHVITPAELTAATVTLTGLTGETTYTATLQNGTKTRGTLTFTTLLDLGGATAVTPTDSLPALLANAPDGAVFALMPGTYKAQDLMINKNVSLKGARPTNKPILKGVLFRIGNSAGLQLKDLTIDGTGASDGQPIIYNEDQTTRYNPFVMENCIIKNFAKGLIYVNKKAWIQSVLFKGNIISEIPCNAGDFVDFRTGIAETFDFINNTVYNCVTLARDGFRMDVNGSNNFPSVKSIITIQNNTFNNSLTAAATSRYLYIRATPAEITFSKNIIANSLGYYSNQAVTNTNLKAMDKNNYFQTPTMISAPGVTGPGTNYTTLDPGFANAATGDFTISNIDLKAGGIGDPRWIH